MTLTRWTLRKEPYKNDPPDADNDGIVQEQTVWERPRGVRMVDKVTGQLPAEGLVGSFGNQRSQFKFQRQNPTSGVWEDIPEGSPELRPSWQGQLSIGEQRGTIGGLNSTVGALMEPPAPPRRPYGMYVSPDDRPRVDIDTSPLLDRVEREMAVFRTSSKYLDDVPADRRRFHESILESGSLQDFLINSDTDDAFDETSRRLEELEKVYGPDVASLSNINVGSTDFDYKVMQDVGNSDEVKALLHDSPVAERLYASNIEFTDASISSLSVGQEVDIVLATVHEDVDSVGLIHSYGSTNNRDDGNIVVLENFPAFNLDYVNFSDFCSISRKAEQNSNDPKCGTSVVGGVTGRVTDISDGVPTISAVGSASSAVTDGPLPSERVPVRLSRKGRARKATDGTMTHFWNNRRRRGGIGGLADLLNSADNEEDRKAIQAMIDKELERLGIEEEDIRLGIIHNISEAMNNLSPRQRKKYVRNALVYYEVMNRAAQQRIIDLKNDPEIKADEVPTLEQFMAVVAATSPAKQFAKNAADTILIVDTILRDREFSPDSTVLDSIKSNTLDRLVGGTDATRTQAAREKAELVTAVLRLQGRVRPPLTYTEEDLQDNDTLVKALSQLRLKPSQFSEVIGSDNYDELQLLAVLHPRLSLTSGSTGIDNTVKGIRILRNPDDIENILNGRKVEGFSAILSNPLYNSSVIDTWMARMMFHPDTKMIVRKKLRKMSDRERCEAAYMLVTAAEYERLVPGSLADSLRSGGTVGGLLADNTGIIPLVIDLFNEQAARHGLSPGEMQALCWELSRSRGGWASRIPGRRGTPNDMVTAEQYAAVFLSSADDIENAYRQSADALNEDSFWASLTASKSYKDGLAQTTKFANEVANSKGTNDERVDKIIKSIIDAGEEAQAAISKRYGGDDWIEIEIKVALLEASRQKRRPLTPEERAKIEANIRAGNGKKISREGTLSHWNWHRTLQGNTRHKQTWPLTEEQYLYDKRGRSQRITERADAELKRLQKERPSKKKLTAKEYQDIVKDVDRQIAAEIARETEQKES